jgi:hypothetical protein
MATDIMRRRGTYGQFPAIVERIEVSSDCWLWTGSTNNDGYGHVKTDEGPTRGVHRVIWEALVGPIPEGLSLDHMCRVRNCVNPDHLRPVTHAENVRADQVKAQCKYGHRRINPNGSNCRTCHIEAQRKARVRT